MRVLAYVISPVHVIGAVAAARSIHPTAPVRITIAVYWPGVPAEQVEEIAAIVRQMANPLSDVDACMVVTGERADSFERQAEVDPGAARRGLFGDTDFAEIYYAHDVVGRFYQALAMAFPHARRICYGDGLGNVYQRDYHLGLLRDPTDGSEKGEREPRRGWWRNCLASLRRCVRSAEPVRAIPSQFQPDAAALILPVDQSGGFLRDVQLTVVPRATALQLFEHGAAGCTDFIAHIDDLLARHAGRTKYLLLTENNAEGHFLAFDKDVEMYCAVVRDFCAPDSVIILKAHPGESLPRNEAIRASLGGDFEVVEIDPRFKRYPVELAVSLVRECKVICMSYPRLSLKYLYGIDVIQPMDDAFIERWFAPQFWRSYKNAVTLYEKPLERLAGWDGRGVLWAGAPSP
jgi:hypothetical protein